MVRLTFNDPENIQIPKIGAHAARRQRVLAVPEEVLADLRVPQRLHVVGGAVDAAAGFVDAEHADALVVGAGGEFAR